MNQEQQNFASLILGTDQVEAGRLSKERLDREAAEVAKKPLTSLEQREAEIAAKRAELKALAHERICTETPKVYETKINDLSATIRFQRQRLDVLNEVLIPDDHTNYAAYCAKRDDRAGIKIHGRIGPFNEAVRNFEKWTDALAESEAQMKRLRKLHADAKTVADAYRASGKEKRYTKLKHELELHDLKQRVAAGNTHLLSTYDRAIRQEETLHDLPYRGGRKNKD